MKKKQILAVLGLTFCLALAACGGTSKKTADTSGNQTTVTESKESANKNSASDNSTSDSNKNSSDSSSSASDSDKKSKTSLTSSQSADSDKKTAEEEKKLYSLLEELQNGEVGTAGSSMKIASIAVDLCDYLYTTPLTSDQIASTAEQYLNDISSDNDKVDDFRQVFDAVESQYKLFIDSSNDETSLFKDAGIKSTSYPYGNQQIPGMETLIQVVSQKLGM
jgi:hypothetical protein